MPLVLAFGLAADGICGVTWIVEKLFEVEITLEVTPFEFAGVVLGLLILLRTNAGYDRWWEARVLWGGIRNQSRNFVISAMAYGPTNSEWREKIVRWAAVYPHVARLNLRGELPSSEVANLVGPEDAKQVAAAEHMPSFVALKLGDLLREATDKLEMDRYGFIQVDLQRALLIDHVGACERMSAARSMSSTSGPCGPSPNRMRTAEDLVSESGGRVKRDSSWSATPSMATRKSANHRGNVP